MDHRCPACQAELSRQKKMFSSVLMQLDVLCPACRRPIRINLHRAETAAINANFAAILAFIAAGYYFKNDVLYFGAVCAVMLGSLSLPVLDRALKTWPRYVLPAEAAKE
jgi:hypothetical protein